VSAITSSTASRVPGGLLAVIGLLGALILALDHVLWETASMHAYGLIVFVIVDFSFCAFVLARSSKTAFALAGAWCILRIIIQIGDISLGPSFGLTYAQFADYLFNPAATNPPNATGIPGALIDIILILEIVVIWTALKGRSSITKT
jgi:hypothetical protein